MLYSFHQTIKPYLKKVDLKVQEISSSDRRVATMSEKFFSKNGKGIRASVVFLSALACGVDLDKIVDFASAVELLHSGSLIHDDIIDNEKERRGQESLNNNFGVSKAVLFGDILIVRSLEVVLSYNNNSLMEKTLQTASMMCESALDEEFLRGNDEITEEEYIKIAEGKTASLFSLAAFAPSKILGIDEKPFADFGFALGMAFQLLDDGRDCINDAYEGFYSIVFTGIRDRLKKEKNLHRLDKLKDYLQDIEKNKEDIKEMFRTYGGFARNALLILQYLNDAKEALNKIENNSQLKEIWQYIYDEFMGEGALP